MTSTTRPWRFSISTWSAKQSLASFPGPDVQVQEPLEKEIVLKALTELAFTPDGVESNEQAAFEQMFCGNPDGVVLRDQLL
jgi:hypothetical protein